MYRTILVRSLLAVPLVVLVSIMAFALVHLMPGSASETILGDGATPETVAELDAQLGLDRPIVEQYVDWAGHAVHGDFGRSLISEREVSTTLARGVPVTLWIAVAGLLFAVVVGVVAGIGAALARGGWLDKVVSLTAATGLAIPSFWLAVLLAYWVGVRLEWLPAVGYTAPSESMTGWVKSLILPGISLGLGSAAVISRQMRSALLDVLDRPYIRTARSKGLSPSRVIVVHGLKNALTPVVTVIGFQASVMLGGAFVVEQVFGMPGIGGFSVKAVLDQDIPIIQGVVMVTALVVILVNVVVDVSYAVFDPRVRVQ